jgi:bifunctional DNA-binding transcriptional regulator/antitoxin component of YhaV-PrlF toxin-antitoxin module
MVMIDEAIVGKKGEILPKKSLREMMGLMPGDKVYIEAYEDKMILRKVYSIDEIYDLPYIDHGTPEQIEEDIDNEATIQEEQIVKKLNSHIR